MTICEHIDCWRDCDRHPDLECFVLDCPHNPAPDYDCEEGYCVRCEQNKDNDLIVVYRHDPICSDCITHAELVELGLK